MSDPGARAISLLGFVLLLCVSFVCSSDRRRIAWRGVWWGVGLQVVLAVALLRTPLGELFFRAMSAVVDALTRYTDAGVRFVFGALVDTGFSFVVNVLPVIVVMGSLFAVLYHLGLLQRVVDALAAVLARTMGTSGAESLAAGANLFLGMTESALIVRPYLARMTSSELFSVMTVGMSTVAGSVMLAYVGMLGKEYAGHLATASLLSLPAGLLVAKMMVPETGTPLTGGDQHARVDLSAVNVVDAAAQGALAGMRLAGYVGATLLAFIALIALANDALAQLGLLVGVADLSLQRVLGLLMAPVAFLLGVPWHEAAQVGALLGLKTVLNEFLAYQDLARLIESGALSPRSARIASYACCGFANFGSLAILLGGLGELAPGRRSEVARFGLKSILSGTLASFMTAALAGVLL